MAFEAEGGHSKRSNSFLGAGLLGWVRQGTLSTTTDRAVLVVHVIRLGAGIQQGDYNISMAHIGSGDQRCLTPVQLSTGIQQSANNFFVADLRAVLPSQSLEST